MVCNLCGTEEIKLFYNGANILKWDNVAEEHVACESRDVEKYLKDGKRGEKVRANASLVGIYTGIMIAEGLICPENIVGLDKVVSDIAITYELILEQNPEIERYDGLEAFVKLKMREYYGM